MDFSGSHAEIEKLLKCFLIGTQNLPLSEQILDIGKLPRACREHVRAAESKSRAWTAWRSERGPMVAWVTYDAEASNQLKAHVLYVEWFTPPDEIHAIWCRCHPK